MSHEPYQDDRPRPTGFRLLRNGAVIKEFTCPMCPERTCLCPHYAWEDGKREAMRSGGRITLETFEGVKLSERQGTKVGTIPKSWLQEDEGE